MHRYDPDKPMAPAEWLQEDEGDRIELIASYHRRQKVRLPNGQLHAIIHVIVENQLALGEEVVVRTLARLQAEGLSRHDALHAIGSVLATDMYELMRDDTEKTSEPYRRYLDNLEMLTAKAWLAG